MPSHPPIQCEAVVRLNEKLAGEVYRLALGVGADFPRPEPGQFVFLRVAEGWDPFLRRPMGVFDFQEAGDRRVLEILYRVVGRGTRLLTARRKGDPIDMVGPLGCGFTPDPRRARLLVAGGMGAAPLVLLSRSSSDGDVFLLGCRSAADFPVDFIRDRVSIPFRVVTEDGTRGSTGLATDLAREVGHERGWAVEIAAAGPSPMLRALADIAGAHGVRCQVSLEARMACGVGSCLGCVVPTHTPNAYRRACREGPVFEAGDVRWEALP